MIDKAELEKALGEALIQVTFHRFTSQTETSLAGISKGKVINVKAKDCIITLSKILDNILREKKYNPKTRSIKLTNRLFREKIGLVPGATDFLLACNFLFARLQSTPQKRQPNFTPNESSQPNVIQLTKQREDRSTLIYGRIYLHKFGKEVLSLSDNKKNELPQLKSFREVSENIDLQNVGQNIEGLVEDFTNEQERKKTEDTEEEKVILMNGENANTPELVIHNGNFGSDTMSKTSDSSKRSLLQLFRSKIVNQNSNVMEGGDKSINVKRKEDKMDELNGGDDVKNELKKKDDEKDELSCSNLIPSKYSSRSLDTSHENKEMNGETDRIDTDVETRNEHRHDDTFDSADEVESYKSSHRSVSTIDNLEENFQIQPLNSSTDILYDEIRNENDVLSQNSGKSFHGSSQESTQLDPQLDSAGNLIRIESDLDEESVSSFATGLTREEKEAFDNLSRYANSDKNGDGGCDDEGEMILSVLDNTFVSEKGKNGSEAQSWSPFTKDINKSHDSASVCSYGSRSAIHIKNNHIFNTKCKSKMKNPIDIISENESDMLQSWEQQDFFIENAKLSSKLSQEESRITYLALKLFFAIIAIVSNQPSECSGETNLPSAIEEFCEDGSSFPIEIFYLLWVAILRSEKFSSLCYNSTYHILKKATLLGAKVEKVVPHYTLISGEDIRICNFISATLKELNLLKVTYRKLGNSALRTRKGAVETMIMVNKPLHRIYGERLTKQNFVTFSTEDPQPLSTNSEVDNTVMAEELVLERKRVQWHGILVKILFDNMAFKLDNRAKMSSSNPTAVWYSARLLPIHLLKAQQWRDAENLLLDKNFLRCRYTSCGLINGTKLYIKEFLIFSKVNESETLPGNSNANFDSQCLSEEFDIDLKEAVYDMIRSFLQKEKMLFSQKTKNSKEENASTIQMANEFSDALRYLGAAFGGELKKYTQEIDLYNEALRLKRAFNSDENIEPIAEILVSMGACYYNLNDYHSARARYAEALCIYESLSGGQDEDLSKIHHNMGILHCELGELQESLDSFKSSLDLCHDHVRKNEVDTICWMGRVHRDKNEYNSALDCFLRALSSMESLVGKNHVHVAEILQNLGVLYDDMEKFDESLECYQECLRIRRNELDDDQHEDICQTLTCIANVFRRIDINKAIQFFRSIANAREKNSTKTSQSNELRQKAYQDLLDLLKEKLEINSNDKDIQDEIVSVNMKIGNVCEQMERYREAIAYYCKSLKMQKIRKDDQSIGNILNSLGIAHAKRACYKKSMKCFNDSLLVRKCILGPKHPDVAEILHNIGNCASKQGFYEKAAESYEESLEIKRLMYGDDSISTMKTLHNIGIINEASGDIEKALSCYQNALKVRIGVLGDDHLDVAFSFHSIGKVHMKRNNFKDAVECFKTSLRIKRRHYVATHLSVAETMHQIAIVMIKQENETEAIEYLEMTLTTFEKQLGTHIDTANVLDSLASIFESKGELERAHRYLERALVLKRMILGNEHIGVSDTLYLIGKVQVKSGDVEDALLTFKEVLRIRRKLQGKDSSGVAAVINDVGVIHLRRGHNELAKSCFLETMRVWELHLNDNHDYVGETLVNLGEIEQCEGNFNEAIAKLVKALRIFETSRGANHLSVAFVSSKLGKSYHCNEDFGEALLLHEKALSIRSLHLSPHSLLVAETLKDLGSVHFDKADFGKARHYLGEAMQTMLTICPNDIEASEVSFLLGKVMAKMKYKDEAIRYFKDALKIRKNCLDIEDIGVADTLYELGIVIEDCQNYDQSIELHQQALKIRLSILGEDEGVANIHHNIGALQLAMEKFQQALSSFGAALFIYQKCLGDDHLSCAKMINNIGIVYGKRDSNLPRFFSDLWLRVTFALISFCEF